MICDGCFNIPANDTFFCRIVNAPLNDCCLLQIDLFLNRWIDRECRLPMARGFCTLRFNVKMLADHPIIMSIWKKHLAAVRFSLRYCTLANGSGIARILCYGDSNTWGYPPGGGRRLGPSIRWPGALQHRLGSRAIVFEEGLSGRTTDVDDPQLPGRNGRSSLMPIVRHYAPLDVVVLALGTNDLKHRFDRPASAIAEAVGRLCGDILNENESLGNRHPEILLMAPPPIRRLSPGQLSEFDGAVEKSSQLPGLYRRVARRIGVQYMEAGLLISASRDDPVHWDSEAHLALGLAVADRIGTFDYFKKSGRPARRKR
jgi:lysophospholipase L1-like esterase